MASTVRGFALALLVVLTGSGAADLFPVTNMRYGTTTYTNPLLRSNGRDVFVFWASPNHAVMMAKYVSGQWSPGHRVPDLYSHSHYFDAVWTGAHFLVVSGVTPNSVPFELKGRLMDEHGQPVGNAFTIAKGLVAPRLAASRSHVFLSANNRLTYGVDTYVLTPDGTVQSSTTGTRDYGGETVSSNGSGFATLGSASETLTIRVYDASVQQISETVLSTKDTRGFALGSDGSRYLATWSEKDGLHTALFDGNGTKLGEGLAQAGVLNVSTENAVWNGRGWTLAFDTWNDGAFVANLDEAAQIVESLEPADAQWSSWASPASFASTSRETFFAWSGRNPSGGRVARLPLARNETVIATTTPNDQELLAAASSDTAILLVWREHDALFAGVRTETGQWLQYELLSGYWAHKASAASDGTNFVVIADEYESSNGAMLFRLNGAGAPIVPPQKLGPGYGQVAVAWNGSWFAVYRGGEAQLLSPLGRLMPPKQISGISENPVLASNGNGFLLVGDSLQCCCYLGNCFPYGVLAVRLSSDLRMLDEQPLDLAEGYGSHAGAIWNGAEYIVAWGDPDNYGSWGKSGFARIPPGPFPPQIHSIERLTEQSSLSAMKHRQFAIAYNGNIRVMSPEAIVVSSSVIDPQATIDDRPRLLPLGNSGTHAYVSARTQDGEPYSGSRRIAMSILSSAPLPRPAPPAVAVTRNADALDVSWNAPAGSVNGYRVEWRVDDRTWVELAQWFGPAEMRATIDIPHSASRMSVRVRAFNDGGAGAYSAEARTMIPSRRRAVH